MRTCCCATEIRNIGKKFEKLNVILTEQIVNSFDGSAVNINEVLKYPLFPEPISPAHGDGQKEN